MEQPVTPGQDPAPAAPAAQAPPAPAAPAAAPLGTGPWANDLAQAFTDPAVQASVDSFLRAKVQPYTTQLEQQNAAAQQAMNLWTQLESDPVTTYVQMTNEIYGEAAAQAVLETLQNTLQGEQAPAATPAAPAQDPTALDPRLSSVIDYVEQQQAQSLYSSEIERVKGAHPDIAAEIDKGLLHAFVPLANGDFDKAVTEYRAYRALYGAPQEAQLPPPPETPPNVMGSDSASATTSSTPLEPKKQTLNAAIDDFMAELRTSSQAPPVGVA